MEEELVDLLIKKGLKITFAESCTAGLISSTLVNVNNASKVFDISFVTYSNESKINILNVSKELISKYGVVSNEVALDMAKKAKELANAQVSIGVSGIAGPSGGSIYKPVGTVCFGFVAGNKEVSETIYIKENSRNDVRNEAKNYAISRIVKLVKEVYYD